MVKILEAWNRDETELKFEKSELNFSNFSEPE